MKCPKCNDPEAKKLRPLNLSFVEQGLGEGVPNFLRVGEPVACPRCGLLLFFGESFTLPPAGVLPDPGISESESTAP
jgi:hypothetical protein